MEECIASAHCVSTRHRPALKFRSLRARRRSPVLVLSVRGPKKVVRARGLESIQSFHGGGQQRFGLDKHERLCVSPKSDFCKLLRPHAAFVSSLVIKSTQIFHAQLLKPFPVFYFVELGETGVFEFGNGSHIPHDFAFFFISHFIPGKQHNRRFPDASISQAFSIRRLRVSGCLAELIEKIQSRRAIGVIPAHNACASGASARALRRSIGTLVSGSSAARVISTVTVSPASAPAASCKALLTLSQ